MGMQSKRSRRPVAGGGTTPGAGVAGALFSTTQQRLLALLFGQVARRFFANELIALTGSGSGAIQRELKRLTDSGLVTRRQEGNRKYFQANSEAPLFAELQSIVLKTVGAAEPVKDALNRLGSRVQLAFIYGSIAKGNDTASSDLDLLVVSDALTLEQLYAAVSPAESRLARKVNVTLYTSGEYRRRLKEKSPFLTKVLAGDHIPLIGSNHELAATR